MAAKAINHSIPGQLSSYINEDYPLFVEFLSGYYEWLESEGSPYFQIKNHLSAMDFKASLDGYADMLKSEYLNSIPEKVIVDKEILIKHSRQFFQSLGTEKSFQFLFKILYGESIELYYPKNDVLRASDAKWIDNENLMYVTNSGSVNDFLYRRIEQTRETFPGIYETSSATVNRVINRYANKFNFAEIYLTDIVGEFKLDWPIAVGAAQEWILPIADEVVITSAGMNYATDNSLTYAGDETFDITIQAAEAGTVNCRYPTIIAAAELHVEFNGVQAHNFVYDGQWISHSSIVPGMTVTVRYPLYKGFLTIDQVGASGVIQGVNLVDTPFGIVKPQTYLANEGGSGGIITLTPSVTKKIDGYFMTTDSFPSSDKMLQDSEYYQDYSYVIKAGIDVDKYRDVVMKVLHPAGLRMYGEVNILEFIKLLIRDVSFTISVQYAGDISFTSAVSLFNRIGFIEDFKYSQTSQTNKVNNYKDVVVQDIFTGYMKPLNRHYTSTSYTEFRRFVADDYAVDQDDYVAGESSTFAG